MSQEATPVSGGVKALQLRHGGLGRLLMLGRDGQPAEAVLPVRAFPLQAPDEAIALVSESGMERVWIEHVDELNPQARSSLLAALAEREFMPEIIGLLSVSTPATPSVWQVQTNRGQAELILKGEEDIRVLPGPGPRLLIHSAHGVIYAIPDLRLLDRKSKKLLERFL